LLEAKINALNVRDLVTIQLAGHRSNPTISEVSTDIGGQILSILTNRTSEAPRQSWAGISLPEAPDKENPPGRYDP
jgi:hypothetical protein